jgi:hypothetical protein
MFECLNVRMLECFNVGMGEVVSFLEIKLELPTFQHSNISI